MKKVILVFAALAFTAGAYTQTGSTNKQQNPRKMNKTEHQNVHHHRGEKMHPDGVMMQDGKILKVENGQMTTLDHDMTMSNGTNIFIDGRYTDQDGTRSTLKEGQHIDMEGNLTFLEKDKNMYLVPDSIVPDNTRKRDQ